MLTELLADAKSTIKSRFSRDETGATAVEYGIMVALIAVVIIAAVTLLGGNMKTTFESTACSIKGGTYTASSTASDGTTTASSCSK